MNNNANLNNNQMPNTNLNVLPQQPIDGNVNNGQNIQPNVISGMPQNNSVDNNFNNFTLGTTPNVGYMDTINNAISPNPNQVNNPQQVNMPNTNQPTNEISQPQNNSINEQSNNMINNLNVDGAYNGMQAPDYVNEQVVRQNIQGQKKNTIPITKELKTVIVIALVLLVFIIIMPILFDLLNKIKFH